MMSQSLGDKIRGDFPILNQRVYEDKPLVYLDSAATSQKPTQVIESIENYYKTCNANVHRGAHSLSIKSTEEYENTRDKIKTFINAKQREEIIFVRGATEGINLVANSWGMANINEGDEIVLTVMEHHSNLVPWQILAQKKKAKLLFVNLNSVMMFDMDHFKSLLSPSTKLVACVHASNTLGCINPIKDICSCAHKVGARVLVDACQSVPNMKVDVQDLNADWLVASGHKMLGPTGIGFLYGKFEVLNEMPPWHGGGEMIDEVYLDYSTYAGPPSRFEAGTPAIAQVIGLGAAIDYLNSIGMNQIEAYERELSSYLYDQLSTIKCLTLYGPPMGGKRTPLVAFNCAKSHAHDLSFFMDQEGICIRAGHHCTQPLHRLLGAAGSLRASCYIYNTKDDIDSFIKALKQTIEMLDAGANEPLVSPLPNIV